MWQNWRLGYHILQGLGLVQTAVTERWPHPEVKRERAKVDINKGQLNLQMEKKTEKLCVKNGQLCCCTPLCWLQSNRLVQFHKLNNFIYNQKDMAMGDLQLPTGCFPCFLHWSVATAWTNPSLWSIRIRTLPRYLESWLLACNIILTSTFELCNNKKE